MNKNKGFTLIELLAVITIIAVLIGMVMTAAFMIINSARRETARSTARSLEVALASYRHEYGTWPIPDSLVGSVTNSPNGNMLTVAGNKNYLLFDRLRDYVTYTEEFKPNTNNVHFTDNSAIWVDMGDGKFTKRHRVPVTTEGAVEAGHPLCYRKSDGTLGYYSIVIEFDTDTCVIKQEQGQ